MITAATNTFHETGRNHRTISQDEQNDVYTETNRPKLTRELSGQLERDQHATSRPRNNNMLGNYGASRNGFCIYAD